MCKYSGFGNGQTVGFTLEKKSTCRKCGSRTDEPGSTRICTYDGHVSSRVYGYCDKLTYLEPVVCPGCGAHNDYILVPCDDDSTVEQRNMESLFGLRVAGEE